MSNMETFRVARILLYGGSNLVTKLFLKEFNANNISGKISLLTESKDVYEEIQIYQPTHIIYYRDYEDSDNNIQIDLNLIEPLVLLQYCNKCDIHMTYIGTGYIYKCTQNNNNFSEKIEANNFDSSYLIAKSSIDKLIIKLYYDVVLNIRIKLPIYFNNNPQEVLDILLRNSEICKIPNSITLLNDFIPQIVSWIMEYRIGTINAANSGYITKYDIKNLYTTYNINKQNVNDIINNTIDMNTNINLPLNIIDVTSKLELSKLHSWWNKCPHINRSIIKLLSDYQKNNLIKTLVPRFQENNKI